VSNALVPLAPLDRAALDRTATDSQTAANARATGHPQADFIAHLIATSGKAPQTCARRRAEPEEARAAYSALSQWPTVPGRKLSRSL